MSSTQSSQPQQPDQFRDESAGCLLMVVAAAGLAAVVEGVRSDRWWLVGVAVAVLTAVFVIERVSRRR